MLIRGNSTRSNSCASPEQTQAVPVGRDAREPAISVAKPFSTLAFSHSTTGFWSAGAVRRWATSVSQLPRSALWSAWTRWLRTMRRMPLEPPPVASFFAQWIAMLSPPNPASSNPQAFSAWIHAAKYSPWRLFTGLPVRRSTGPQLQNSQTFSMMIRFTRSSVSQVMMCQGSDRCWSDVGLPPRATEWCVQVGEAIRRSR